MAEARAELSALIARLIQENRELKTTCEGLHTGQQMLETAIADANSKQLRAEINGLELEEIFTSISDPMWSLRDDGIVIRANEAMLGLLDKPLEQVVGRQCSELLDYGLCHTDNCPLVNGLAAGRQELDIEMEQDSKHPQHYIITVAPLTTIVGTNAIVVHFKNITARKHAENQLAELNRTLSEMARIDGLTGIANRRFFDETLDREWRRLLREGTGSIALILADIDYFKKYNDRYGHQAGDDCLIKVARALKQSVLRPSDLTARYGGEEFVFLLPDIDQTGARTVGIRALSAVTTLAIEHQDSDITDHITISMGIATLKPTPETSPSQLIAMADKALYQSKQQGRNRLTLA